MTGLLPLVVPIVPKDRLPMQYRTEIYVALDRYVCLQLPDFIPAGRAFVTVNITTEPNVLPTDPEPDREADAADIEWWDEFDADDDPRRG